jgi:drug/metabolite transporter (DMT)-like permease
VTSLPDPALRGGIGSQRREPFPAVGLLSLFAVYVVWSSTYLAIRIAVREDSGFPPFTMAGSRILLSGLIMLAISLILRNRLKLARVELIVLALSGVLLWVGGNGLVTWAEQRAHSGYAALLVGSMPIWVATIEAVVDRKPPSPALVSALLVGFAGLAILVGPVVASGAPADVFAALALLIAPMTFAAGSILQKRRPVAVGTLASAGYQALVGGTVLLLLALITREPMPQPIPEAVAAWAYLVAFGSVVGFTAYIQVLRSLPMNIAATYAYVNPVGAVILGWLLLGEPITLSTVAGAALVLLGVAGVFREQLRSQSTS